MECLIVEQADVNLADRMILLRGEEAHHAAKVLRLREGEEFLASDTVGTSYRARFDRFEQLGKHEVVDHSSVLEILSGFGDPSVDVRLVIGALSQPARWEFVLEKATELGVTAIQPIASNRTEKRNLKLDRSERILRAALKQSKRSRLPTLGELSTLSAALSEAVKQGRHAYILHEAVSEDQGLLRQLQQYPSSSITLVVGPEGGFTEEEVEEAIRLGAKVASLGRRRLRAETAAIAALAIAQSVS